MRRNHHEQIYRGKPAMDKLGAASIHICGVGALGSNLAINLARTGVGNLCLIDRDRVEEHNISTQIYGLDDVGARKAELVRNVLARELGIDATAVAQELTERNINKTLKAARIVVDTFDNSLSRKLVTDYCMANKIPCLHAGVNDEYGEVAWNESYRVPADPKQGGDACDYPLARNLIMLVTTTAAESLLRFVITGEKQSYAITMGDLSITRTDAL